MAKTLKDVAQVAGVSSATASLVLNGRADGRVSADLADRVEKAAEKLNYRPNLVARSLRTQVSKTLGLISNDVATSPFAGAMLAGAKEIAWKQGWLLFLVNTNEDKEMEAAATHSLIQRNVDGFIMQLCITKRLIHLIFLRAKPLYCLTVLTPKNVMTP